MAKIRIYFSTNKFYRNYSISSVDLELKKQHIWTSSNLDSFLLIFRIVSWSSASPRLTLINSSWRLPISSSLWKWMGTAGDIYVRHVFASQFEIMKNCKLQPVKQRPTCHHQFLNNPHRRIFGFAQQLQTVSGFSLWKITTKPAFMTYKSDAINRVSVPLTWQFPVLG